VSGVVFRVAGLEGLGFGVGCREEGGGRRGEGAGVVRKVSGCDVGFALASSQARC
jgi:hypothetical protein